MVSDCGLVKIKGVGALRNMEIEGGEDCRELGLGEIDVWDS